MNDFEKICADTQTVEEKQRASLLIRISFLALFLATAFPEIFYLFLSIPVIFGMYSQMKATEESTERKALLLDICQKEAVLDGLDGCQFNTLGQGVDGVCTKQGNSL